MRRKLIIANLKMYLSTTKSILLAKKIRDTEKSHDVILAPSFTALYSVGPIVAGAGMSLSAQNMYSQDYGAYTGEISASDLKELGCKYVILGHSERRKYFKETDENVNNKIKQALKYNLTPIICVGENLRERRSGNAFKTIEGQLKTALKDISKKESLIVAYEPIWAIGTGHPEDPKDANGIHGMIKKHFLNNNDKVVYGGSVNASNYNDFLKQTNIDGLLVGGASTKIDEFSKIIN